MCSRHEQAHFTVVLSGKTGFCWIGLRAHGGLTGGVDYVWDKEQPGTVQTNSGKHSGRRCILETPACLSPDSGDGSCVAMAADKIGGFWDDKQCSEKFFFFCEKSRLDITPPTKAPTPPPSQGCTDSRTALPHFRNCYKVTIAE